ncbi:hypothetical protein QQP08_021994 [Theobroma cacao]|nr:hypothetical protein QQP08_021994 [Theobroma cacao]
MASSLAELTIMLWLMAHRLCIFLILGLKFFEVPLNEPRPEESIANLKTKANAEVGTGKISSLQALLSYIWRTVIRCKNLDPVEETNLFLPVSAKSRLHQLSQQYIGNAMLGGVITMKVKDLLEKGLRNAAWETNKSISSV